MSKIAYFVVGAEGSGTRMMTHALTLSGVHEDYAQWDFGDTPTLNTPHDKIVIHRSLPHGQAWPNLYLIEKTLREAGFSVVPIAMIRDINATVNSQLRRGYCDTWLHGYTKARNALQTIFAQLPTVTPVTYEAFCLNPKFRTWLFTQHLKLPNSTIDIQYANEKYY